jgi:hypothetical protein
MNETKICKVCNLEYHISDFKTGIQTIKKYNKCKKCRNAKKNAKLKVKNANNVTDQVAIDMYQRFNPNPKGITIKTFSFILDNLDKICYISGIELTEKNNCYNTLSPERINESKDYLEKDNVTLICRLFQSASHAVDVETEKTTVKKYMKTQILKENQEIQRISNERCQKYIDGTLYKKIIKLDIDFNNEDEVKEEMNFLPNNMRYNKRHKTFCVKKGGDCKSFGKKLGTLQERYKKAIEYYKEIYHSEYGSNDETEYGLIRKGKYNKIYICPKTNYMTIYINQFKIHQLYTNLPECNPGKPQWTPNKFNSVKELNCKADSKDRCEYINKIIEESKSIVEDYRNNDEARLKFKTPLIQYINEKAYQCSNCGERKSGNYKKIFLAIYDKICENRLRCDYSNIPMSLSQRFDWSLSIERIDNRKPYSRENILLVCAEFNTREHWKPEHFMNFWGFDNLDFETKMKFVLC